MNYNNDNKKITYQIDNKLACHNRDKIYGCIIGGAIGDALGYPVEFLSEKEMFDRYGKNGIREYELSNGEALISDDTQMTMFTITAMLCCEKMFDLNSNGSWPPNEAYYHYRDWYKTQTKSYEDCSKFDRIYSWLMKEKRMYAKRAPGNTCLNALSNNNKCSIDNRINDSKGCGGLMRVAPVGLVYAFHEDEEIASCGAEMAALTHGHSLGYIPAAFLALFIAKPYIEMDLEAAYEHTYKVIKKMYGDISEFSILEELLEKAVELGNKDTKPIDAIHKLGKGWVAEEALAISIYCSFRFRDNFENAIFAAVNHSGDSDSTGSITGQIMGTFLGFSNIPDKYKHNLELKDILYELCDDIHNGCPYDNNDELKIKKWKEKYVDIR